MARIPGVWRHLLGGNRPAGGDLAARAPLHMDSFHLTYSAVDAGGVHATSGTEIRGRQPRRRGLVLHEKVPGPCAQAPVPPAALCGGLQGSVGLALAVKRQPHGVYVGIAIDATHVAPIAGKILPLHPEGPVIALFEAELVLHVREIFPLRAVVRPRARPLTCPPRVPDLHEPEVLVGLGRLPRGAHLQKRKCVFRNEALGLAVGLYSAATQHGPLAMVKAKELKELLVITELVRRPEAAGALVAVVLLSDEVAALPSIAAGRGLVPPSAAAGHADDAPFGDAGLDGGVAPAEFRKSFFEQHRPDLATVRPGIKRLRSSVGAPANAIGGTRISCARDVVVHHDDLPTAFLRVEEADVVLPARINLGREEQGANGALVLCEGRHSREEPTVPEPALQNVFGLDFAFEEAHFGVVQVGVQRALTHIGLPEVHSPHPCHLRVVFPGPVVGEIATDIAQGGRLGRKLRVHEIRSTAAECAPKHSPAVHRQDAEQIDPHSMNGQCDGTEQDVV
mmetsp:Transcript_103705/g.298629  ORF Transcript_103705/g.298629 Transcript_103705/m.298629 type:complete len:508 (+) Transcript_103705:101-1624(+)